MQETDIIEAIYAAYENDNDTWDSTSAEYLTARILANMAIKRWAKLEGVRWNELYKELADATDGDKTTLAGDASYGCPSDMMIPPQVGEYVGIGGTTYVIEPISRLPQLKESETNFVYFVGNEKDGFDMKVNSNVNLTTGATISYGYWKKPTHLSTGTSENEMKDPMFIVHYVLSRFYKSDGLLTESNQEMQVAEGLLDQMRTENTEVIGDELDINDAGFGEL